MKQLLLLGLLFCAANITNVAAQSTVGEGSLIDAGPHSTFSLGITGGLLSSRHTAGGITTDTGYIRTATNSQVGFSVGLVAEQSLNQWLRVSGRLEYRSMPGIIFQAPSGVQLLLPDGPLSMDTVTTTAVDYQDLSLGMQAVAYPLQLLGGVRVMVGAGSSISANLHGTRTRYRAGVTYPSSTPLEEAAASLKEDEGQAKLSSDEPIWELQQFRLGIVGTVGIELQLGATTITPNISYDHSLTNVTNRPEEDGWRVNSLAFRVDIKRTW